MRDETPEIAHLRRMVEAVPGCRFDEALPARTDTDIPSRIIVSGRGPSLHRISMTWPLGSMDLQDWGAVRAEVARRLDVQRSRLRRSVTLGVGVSNDVAIVSEIGHIAVDQHLHRMALDEHASQGLDPRGVFDVYRRTVRNLLGVSGTTGDELAKPEGRLSEDDGVSTLCVPRKVGDGSFDGERIGMPVEVPQSIVVTMPGRLVRDVVDLGADLAAVSRRKIVEARSVGTWLSLTTRGSWQPVADLARS